MPWFIKQETFLRPHAELRDSLQAHRAWVEQRRLEGVRISSGYLVDGAGRPGGGGLLLLEAADFASAEALILQDPMVASGGVRWSLHQWVEAVGDLAVGDPKAEAPAIQPQT
ncbi:MAG: YciI family protein, partial [Cyanobium sp.]